MQKIYFTPGPTQLYPKINQYIGEALENGICSLSHRGKQFQDIFRNTASSLRKLLNVPEDFHIFFLGSATEAMERIIENCVEKHSFHFVNGQFSKRFFMTSQELKKFPGKLESSPGEGFDFSEADIPLDAELACLTQNETSTGVSIPVEQINLLKKKNPEKLFAVDIVSSVPYADIDYSLIDCTFFSVQKGFGMPAGLGVIMANKKIIEKAQSLQQNNFNIGSYHSFPSLLKSAAKNQTPETPNVLGIYLLGKVCDDLLKTGIDIIRKETDAKAKLLYDFFEDREGYGVFVKDADARSKTVVTVDVPSGSKNMVNRLSENGFVVGTGYGDLKEKQIRIANFPMHRIEDMEKMLSFM